MAVVCAQISIRGTRPLLWNHFGPNAIPLERKSKKGVAGNNPDEWRETVLVNSKGQLYLTPSSAFGAIRDGAKHTRAGKGSLQPKVASTLQVGERNILIDRWLPKNGSPPVQAIDQDVYLDVRSVRNPGTRSRNVRYRVACSKGWTATFDIVWDNSIVGEDQMKGVVIDAGSFQGLGDGRTIGLGRFEVTSFKMINLHAKKPTTKRTVASPAA